MIKQLCSINDRVDTALVNNSRLFSTGSISSRLLADSWYSRGLGGWLIVGDISTDSRELGLGREEFSIDLTKNTRQRIRDHIKFPWNVFDSKVASLETNGPTSEHVGGILHMLQIR